MIRWRRWMMFTDEWTDLEVDSKRNSLCNTGSCEFLLTCWMASGYIESTCGGFLYVCCDRNSAKTNENIAINTNRASVPVDYGPVTNDPSKSPPVHGFIAYTPCTSLYFVLFYFFILHFLSNDNATNCIITIIRILLLYYMITTCFCINFTNRRSKTRHVRYNIIQNDFW